MEIPNQNSEHFTHRELVIIMDHFQTYFEKSRLPGIREGERVVAC